MPAFGAFDQAPMQERAAQDIDPLARHPADAGPSA